MDTYPVNEMDIVGKLDRMLGNFITKSKEKRDLKKEKENWDLIMREYGDLIKFATNKDRKARAKVVKKIYNRRLEPKDSDKYLYIHDKNMGKLANWYFTGKLEGDIVKRR